MTSFIFIYELNTKAFHTITVYYSLANYRNFHKRKKQRRMRFVLCHHPSLHTFRQSQQTLIVNFNVKIPHRESSHDTCKLCRVHRFQHRQYAKLIHFFLKGGSK